MVTTQTQNISGRGMGYQAETMHIGAPEAPGERAALSADVATLLKNFLQLSKDQQQQIQDLAGKQGDKTYALINRASFSAVDVGSLASFPIDVLRQVKNVFNVVVHR